ncbi:LppA family lipoprotein [Amycolatopsis sp. cg5]|uniref:LppA family lipoprotein n=1 Tax=Amycolatopsis sp. cg5 TaxID=3238802 RepID=UPI0035232ED9
MDTQHDNGAGELPRTGRRTLRLGCGLTALLCVGAAATMIMTLAVAVIPNPCANFAAICGKQDLVAYMPIFATIVGVATGGIGGWLALRRQRRSGPWILGAWLLMFAGCGYSCSVLSAGPDTAAREAKTTADREQRIAAMRARPDFETIEARYRQMQPQLAAAAANVVPGLRWPSDALLDERVSLCDWDSPHGRGFHGTGAASTTSYTAITEAQWIALETAVRDVAGQYGFTGPPGHQRTGQNDPQPPGFEWTSPEGARLEGYLARFDHEIDLSFSTPCYLPKAQH